MLEATLVTSGKKPTEEPPCETYDNKLREALNLLPATVFDMLDKKKNIYSVSTSQYFLFVTHHARFGPSAKLKPKGVWRLLIRCPVAVPLG